MATAPVEPGSTYRSGEATASRSVEPRDYLVFAKRDLTGGGSSWESIGGTVALTRDGALEDVVGRLPESEQVGTFVAVAARYWQPVTPKVETVVKRTWG